MQLLHFYCNRNSIVQTLVHNISNFTFWNGTPSVWYALLLNSKCYCWRKKIGRSLKTSALLLPFFFFFLFLKKGSKQKLLSGGEKGGGCIFPAFFLSERYRRNLKKSLILDFKPNNLSAALYSPPSIALQTSSHFHEKKNFLVRRRRPLFRKIVSNACFSLWLLKALY